VAYFPATNTRASLAVLGYFLLDKLAQVAFVDPRHYQPRWNITLYTHHAHPWRKNHLDFRD
jgi:hypothetical protein